MGTFEEELEKEVNEIDDFGGDEFEAEPVPPTPPVEPVINPPKDLEPPTETTKIEPPPAEPVVTPPIDESKEPKESDALLALRSKIESLTGELLALKSQRPEEPKAPATKQEEPKTPASQNQEPPKQSGIPKFGEIDFVGNLDMDDVTADKNVFNKVLNQFAEQIMTFVDTNYRPAISRDVMLSIPSVIAHQVKEQAYIAEAVKTFYDENKDLADFKNTVSHVAQAIAAEHPDYQPVKIFEETAKKAREVIGLPAIPTTRDSNTEFQNPAFANTTSRRRTPGKISDLQRELDEL